MVAQKCLVPRQGSLRSCVPVIVLAESEAEREVFKMREKSKFSKTFDKLTAIQNMLSSAPDVCPALAEVKEFFYEQCGLSALVVMSAALADSEGSKMEFSEDAVLLSQGALDMACRMSHVLAVALSTGNVADVKKAVSRYKTSEEMDNKIMEYIRAGN